MILKKATQIPNKTIQIYGSKSISNRLLILSSLFNKINIQNLSTSEDTQLLQQALASNSDLIDIHHAGTAMRFLTSYFAIQEGKTTLLTGSERMKQRPIEFLVTALRDLGAEINYTENKGFPPLEIVGKKLTKKEVKIQANISSQFITSLLLIAAKLEDGLEIELIGDITSRPYLEMTLKILEDVGIRTSFIGQKIKVYPYNLENHLPTHYEVESDWSSASYFYSLAAIGKKNIQLKSFKSQSMQGDSALKQIYWDFFGLKTDFNEAENLISLFYPNLDFTYPSKITLDMNDCPDIAQTLCVTATALKIPFHITGLKTLKVKETDRLLALKNELIKLGCQTEITDNSIASVNFIEPQDQISIATYKDHRMAMSFAPFCLVKELSIEHPEVVEKSYPEFWEDFLSVITID